MSGRPDGSESRGLPDNGRDRTEAVLEKALPEEAQRKPRSGLPRSGKPRPGKTPAVRAGSASEPIGSSRA